MSEAVCFDADATFGRACARIAGAPYRLSGLIDELDHCLISRALVFCAVAREPDSRPATSRALVFCAVAREPGR